MAGELFGFQAGQRLAERDILEQQLGQLSLQQGQQQLRQGEVAIEQGKVNLDNAKITRDRQLEFLKLLSAAEGKGEGATAQTDQAGKEDDLPTKLERMAELSMTAGLPEQAAKYAEDASQIKNNSSLIKQRESDQRNRQLQYAAGLLDNVQDEQGWIQANMLYEVEFGEESPFSNLPYDPSLVEKIKNSVTTQRQKSLIEAAEIKAGQADEQLEKIKGQTKLNKAREELTKTRTTNLQKAGDKTVEPKPGDIKAITDLLVKEYGGAGLPEDLRVLARPVAERALVLKKELNLSPSEAASRAFKEAEEAGDFGGLKERRPKPGTKESPLSLPTEKGKLDSTKLKKNMYYVVKDGAYAGKTVLYTGKKGDEFQVVE